MSWVMLYQPEPPATGDYLSDVLLWEIRESMRGTVIAEGPRMIRLATEQQIGLFCRPLLPRVGGNFTIADG